MSSCPGLHCPGCGGAKVKITAGGVAALTAAIYYATHKQAIDHGADEFVHWLVITVVIVIAAAVAVVMTAAGIKLRAWQRRRAQAAQPSMIILPPATVHAIPAASAQGAARGQATAAIAPAGQPAYPYLNGHTPAPRQVRCPAPSRLQGR